MEEIERVVQKHLANFCKILPNHVEHWRNALQEAAKPVEALSNYAEQIRHIEKADIKYLDEFSILQENLLYTIFNEIECEISILKELIRQLNDLNHDTKNKLSSLERSTVDLNWDSDSPLIRGSALQPALSKILQEGLNFWLYFSGGLKCINENFKNFDIRNQKSMTAFENSLKFDVENFNVTNLLSITQYVNNEKLLT